MMPNSRFRFQHCGAPNSKLFKSDHCSPAYIGACSATSSVHIGDRLHRVHHCESVIQPPRSLQKFSTMAHLPVIVFLFVLECIAAKYVLPDVPWYAHDIPQTEFGEGEVFPSGNSEKLITAQTSMAEIKRLFESVEQMSVRSDESTDESEGPRAWYKPQQDETLHDERKCIDEFPDCQQYADNYMCYEKVYEAWMQRRCRKTCKFCKENCWETQYGCCPDQKTAAEGPLQAGCGVKLCIDLRDCNKYKDECDDDSISSYRKKFLRNNCAYTCRRCKAPSPTADCEARNSRYGCCWNGQEALGPHEKGCLPCEDTYPRACRLFKTCNSPFYNARTFGETHCPKKCGKCGKCFDERMTSNCENWAGRGLCTGIRGWKAYMEENCRKTCGFCKSSESAVSVRTLLGI